MKVAIVMPAYNEEKTIGSVVEKAKKYGKVFVVNDASRDNTEKIAKKSGATVISHKVNGGLGSSLRTGFEHVLKTDSDIIITIDGDGQHIPEEIPKFIEKIKEGYDFVLGERDLRKYPFKKKFGNFFLRLATNFVSGTRLKDTESGFRAFSKEALKKMYLKAERYEIAVEIVYEVGRHRMKAINVPVSSPVYVQGVSISDGIKNFKYLIRRRKRNMKMYVEDVRYVLKRNI
ncbi:glycosyltransferase family 2 protein [Candidatus Aenigmatarchaeota archaeon]